MEKIIKQLKDVGVHIVENHTDIILEVFNTGIANIHEIDLLVNELITEMNKTKMKILSPCNKY